MLSLERRLSRAALEWERQWSERDAFSGHCCRSSRARVTAGLAALGL
jgi:hypothetical protein